MALYNQEKYGSMPDITGLLSPGIHGYIEGDIEGNPGFTWEQKKAMRLYNWRVHLNKLKLADKQPVSIVSMPAGKVEVFVENQTTEDECEYFEISGDLDIKGLTPLSSEIVYYPFVRKRMNKGDIYKWGNGTIIRTTNLIHTRPGDGHRFETLTGIKTSDGQTFSVSAAPLIRAGLLAELQQRVNIDGETVNAYVIVDGNHVSNGKIGRDVKAQRLQVVSAGGTDIVLTALQDNWPSDGATYPLSDYLNVDLAIGIDFPQDISFADFNTYGEKAVHDDYDDILFRSTMNTTDLVGNGFWSEDHYTNCTFRGFQAVAKRYGDGATYADDIVYYDCSQGGISCTSGDSPATNYSYWNQNGGTNIEIYNIGSIIIGTFLHNYVTSGGIIGSSGYNGPGTQCRWDNVHVHDVASGTRQYSATSGSLAVPGAFSTFNNCTWVDCNEFGHYFSREMDIDINNCTFNNSRLGNTSGTSHFFQCTFINSQVYGDDQGQRSSLKNYPDLDAGDQYYPPTVSKKITCLFEECDFIDASMAWVKYGENKVLTVRLLNCTWHLTDAGLNPISGGAYYSSKQLLDPAAVMYRLELENVTFTSSWGDLYDVAIRRDVRLIKTDRLFEVSINNCTINGLPANSSISGLLWSGNTSYDGNWSISPPETYPQYQDIMPVVEGTGNTKAASMPWNWNQSGNPSSVATYAGQVPGSLET